MGRRAHFLAPGGTFCIIEAHPFAACFDDRRTDDELRLLYDYFQGDEAIRIERSGSYAAPDAPMRGVEHYFRKRGTNWDEHHPLVPLRWHESLRGKAAEAGGNSSPPGAQPPIEPPSADSQLDSAGIDLGHQRYT